MGEHPAAGSTGAYDRMSFTFTHAFRGSDFWLSSTLLTVGSGTVVHRPPGTVWLGISFAVAQAHTESAASSIISQPSTSIGKSRIVSIVQAGDFDGGLNYGIAVATHDGSSTRIPVRIIEAETVNTAGQQRYTVAFDFPTTP